MRKELAPIVDQIQLYIKFILTVEIKEIIREEIVGQKYALIELKEPILKLKSIVSKIDKMHFMIYQRKFFQNFLQTYL